MIFKFPRAAERKALAAVRCRRFVGRSHTQSPVTAKQLARSSGKLLACSHDRLLIIALWWVLRNSSPKVRRSESTDMQKAAYTNRATTPSDSHAVYDGLIPNNRGGASPVPCRS